MADNVNEANDGNSGEPGPNTIKSPQKSSTSLENTDIAKEESDLTDFLPADAAVRKSNETSVTEADELDKTVPSNAILKANDTADEQVGADSPVSTKDVGKPVSAPGVDETKNDNAPLSHGQSAPATKSPSTNDEIQKIEPVATGVKQADNLQPLHETGLPQSVEAKLVEDDALPKASRSFSREIGDRLAKPVSAPIEVIKEENTTEIIEESNEKSPQIPSDQSDKKPSESSLKEFVGKASESLSQKKSKLKNTSLTARLYEDQIRTGKLHRLTSVIKNEDGTQRLVNPGTVLQWNTVDITLTGKRPMPSEKCRKGEHNCFESVAARRGRALSASLTHGLYPDFMRLNPKLNEFVAASILEKLRLKGLAAPLHLYRGRYLPSEVLAELVLKPKRKKVTDRYYFGYVPPPNRPRISTEFRQYLQQFAERHRAAESDLCYSYALRRVRHLAGQNEGHVSLPQTLAEVVRAQEEPGFGVKRLRRPHTAVI